MIKYDTYKDSGIEWLGEIPEHWEVRRIKDFTYVKGRIGWQGLRSDDFLDFSDWHCVTGTDFKNGTIDWKNCYYVDESRFIQDNKIQLKENDLLITKDGTIGKIAIIKFLPKKATLNSGVFLTRPLKEKYNNHYMFWLLNSSTFKSFIDYNKNGSTILHLYQNVFERFFYCLPPLTEQTQIATYLDKKTNGIDRKIELLTKKINTYKELRKSLINETVTKGLDKNAVLKDSGIDWIGKIPEHWEVKRFKDICYKNHTGGTPNTSKTESFLGNNTWVTIGDIGNSKFINNSKLKLTDKAIKNSNIPISPKGSLLYSFKLSLGKVAFAEDDIYTNEAIITILKTKKNYLEYLYYMLPIFLLMNASENIYGAKMLNQKLISNSILISPPLEEQKAIANYLDEKTNKIDAIVNNIENQITHLKEIRKALINDVVTGKIKVIENE